MNMPRYGGKRDANQSAILKHANRIPGCKAIDLGAVGEGCPDALIGYRGRNWLCEIKRDDCAPSDSKLSPGQVEWHKDWPGQVAVIRKVEDLWRLLGI